MRIGDQIKRDLFTLEGMSGMRRETLPICTQGICQGAKWGYRGTSAGI